jgi:hypothetical protein
MTAKSIVWLTLIGAIGCACLVWAALEAVHLRRTSSVWDQGIEAAQSSYEVQDVLLLGLVPEYAMHWGGIAWSFDLRLSYRTQDGQQRTGQVSFFRYGSADEYSRVVAPGQVRFHGGTEPFSVRYLPDEPDQATASWAHHALIAGWTRVGGAVLIALMLFGVIGRFIFGKEDMTIVLE